MTTHIQDIANVLEYEDLREVVLVGHSYGGMVISGVADRAASRIAHLVYFDALVPRDGEATLDLYPDRGAAILENVRVRGDGWRGPVPLENQLTAWAATPADLVWLTRNLTPQPIKTCQEPMSLTNPAAQEIPATYIQCTANPSGLFAESIRRAMAAGWRYRELPTGHDAMVTMPRELTDLFFEAAGE
jgi:pimeloyl-ACP methyl ester carboxylesterase